MKKNAGRSKIPEMDFDKHVDRCLSMVVHIKEVKEIAEVIKKIHHEREANKVPSEGAFDE